MTVANVINHISLVLDASGSMHSLANSVVKVADNQIEYLAQRSKECDQETRITVYTFEERNIQCLVYDKDVLRLPSIKGLYKIGGGTPLISATLKAIEDLEKTPELYGEHSFLIYVLTDGMENLSWHSPDVLARKLAGLPNHWTLAAFVPNTMGIHECKKFGFAKDNISIWSTDSEGIKEVGEKIRATTDQFMRSRSVGVRGYKNLFNLDVANLDTKAVQQLEKLSPGQFRMYKITEDIPIAKFVEKELQRPYKMGEGYYQLTKPVEVQPQKVVALYDSSTHSVYTGANARKLIGLPDDHTVKVQPTNHPKYGIYVQSTSVNRKLLRGTNLLIVS